LLNGWNEVLFIKQEFGIYPVRPTIALILDLAQRVDAKKGTCSTLRVSEVPKSTEAN